MKALSAAFLMIATAGINAYAQSPIPREDFVASHSENNSQVFFLLDNDGGISGISSIPIFQCSGIVTPSAVIQNFGTNTLTTATVEYYVDGGAPLYYYWEGSLDPFWSDTIILPPITVAAGNHELTVEVTEANGVYDDNDLNDLSVVFNIVGTSALIPFIETFEQNSLPEGFFIENEDHGFSWEVFDNGQSTNPFFSSMRMPFYINDVADDEDNLYMKNIDLSNEADVQLSFDLAYAYYSEVYWDELKVEVSTDCGNNWDLQYDKWKDDLATAPATDVPFTPEASQWRNETLDLSSYGGNSSVMIRFAAVCGHGNNLYIDNINVGGNVGMEDLSSTTFKLFPNPAKSFATIEFPAPIENSILTICNLPGATVYTQKISSQKVTIPLENFSSGSYLVSIRNMHEVSGTAKLIVLR